MKKIILIIFLFVFLLSVNQIYAQTEGNQIEPSGPRSFALGLTTGTEHGFGAKARIRFNHFALDGAAGTYPWYISYQTQNGETTDSDFDMSFHSDLSCIIFINSDQGRFQNGIRLGGVYDSIAGNAIMCGWTGELTFTSFAICFGVGIQYYPDLIEKLNEHFPKTRNAKIDSDYKYRPYVGVNFIWYLI